MKDEESDDEGKEERESYKRIMKVENEVVVKVGEKVSMMVKE